MATYIDGKEISVINWRNLILGEGEGGVTLVADATIRPPNLASGAGDDNVAGADFYIRGALGRGTGDVGQIIFQTAQVAAADTVQTYETILTLDEDLATFAKTLLIGGVANTKMILGVTIDQGTADNEILALKSSGDVAHGATTLTETDTYGVFQKYESTSGGLYIKGLKDPDGINAGALFLGGFLGENADTTKSTSGRAVVEVYTAQLSGTGLADIVADGNVFAVTARTVGTLLIVDKDGDLWLNGGITTGGGTPSVDKQVFIAPGARTATANASTAHLWVESTAALTIPTGTSAVVASAYFAEPNITATGTVTLASTLYIAAAPTEGTTNAAIAMASGDIKWLGSLDSAAVADQVAIGGYEIGGGNRVLAISQETAVAADTDETKFSNKLQVRINGATYFIMLTAT